MVALSVCVWVWMCVLLILLLQTRMSKCLEGVCADGRVFGRREYSESF